MKNLTRKQLTDRVQRLEQIVAAQNNTLRAIDAGTFLAVYSLLHENKIYLPEFIKSEKDVVDTGVGEAVTKMLEIMAPIEQQKVERVNKSDGGQKA